MVASDGPMVVARPLLGPIVVNSQGDQGLANSARANESGWDKVSAVWTILINSPRPKKVLCGRGGDSPGMLVSNVR